jgi:hypothetical protein
MPRMDRRHDNSGHGHKKPKPIENEALYGKLPAENYAKVLLSNDKACTEPLAGEEQLGRQHVCAGGIITTTRQIGEAFAAEFNARQLAHVQQNTFEHKLLCERREEAAALVFMSLHDFIYPYTCETYLDLSRRELCDVAADNVIEKIETELPWLMEYSQHILHHYYALDKSKLKIKLNFIMDDGVYDNAPQKGGILLNGLLDHLGFYNKEHSPYTKQEMGILCQVLCPSGLPKKKKWSQIDLGVSFTGKRLLGEPIYNTLIRDACKQIHARVLHEVIDEGITTDKLYYGCAPNIIMHNGFEIHNWEVLYPDQIFIVDEEPLNMSFCKCAERRL